MKKEYDNYIFDLYGTLIDIHTDEHKASLWKLMEKTYAVYGSDWKTGTLHDEFFKTDSEERVRIKEQNGCDHPEIKIERVFARLLFEADKFHATDILIAGIPVNELRDRYRADKEKATELVASSEWCMLIANIFRVHSRSRFRLYKNTYGVLKELKDKGKKLYLLSNAAAIFTRPELEASGLLPFFDAVYLSSDHGVMKPDKRFMEALIKGEGLDKNRSVMVGNEPLTDGAAADSCGMDSIIINSGKRGKTIIELLQDKGC